MGPPPHLASRGDSGGLYRWKVSIDGGEGKEVRSKRKGLFQARSFPRGTGKGSHCANHLIFLGGGWGGQVADSSANSGARGWELQSREASSPGLGTWPAWRQVQLVVFSVTNVVVDGLLSLSSFFLWASAVSDKTWAVPHAGSF